MTTNEDASAQRQQDRPKRRRRPVAMPGPQPRPTDEWMLTYMDTVTLLVTLFVLMLSFSTINPDKFNKVAQGLRLDKYGPGVLVGELTVAPEDIRARVVEPAEAAPEEPAADMPGGMVEDLQSELRRQGLADLVEMKVHENVVDLQLNESVLFGTGEADLTDQGLSVIARLAPLVKASKMNVSVDGHSDNIPISTDRFPSNWELSAARAAAVARELIAGGIRATRLHIRGYAATKPVAPNDTAEGRRKNRRVNVVLSTRDADERR